MREPLNLLLGCTVAAAGVPASITYRDSYFNSIYLNGNEYMHFFGVHFVFKCTVYGAECVLCNAFI